MRHGILILNGDNEHPCIQEDSGKCSPCCPNLCTPEGYTVSEAVLLGLEYDNVECTLKEAK